MPDVAIWIESEGDRSPNHPSGDRPLAEALKSAIALDSPNLTVSINQASDRLELAQWICPLTFNLPETVDLPLKAVYQACQDVAGLRQQIEAWGYQCDDRGNCWLPIVLTAKGPLYAEVISVTAQQTFFQPLDLPDRYRQPLYSLGYRLLDRLQATPAVYLLQFKLQGTEIYGDRLFPFPATPALASIGVQQPDLLACHWYCLTGKPLHDLAIAPA